MRRIILLVGVALAILGFYGPWVTSARQAAALTYNALDLAEFCKFVVRAGMGSITRELFLVPIVAAALALALWVNWPDHLSRLRYAVTCVAAVFCLVPLPPFAPPFSSFLSAVYRSTEDRGSFWLSVAGLVGVALIFVFGQRIAGRWRGIGFIALALIGAAPAAWEFFARAMPAVSKVYGSPAMVGWGFVVTMLGFAWAAVSGAYLMRCAGAAHQDQRA